MSAVPKPTTPRPLPGQGLPQERPATRRPGPGRQSVGAAGQARRSLQRDLARREASLRVNRRVSGPVGGIVREPAPQQRPIAPQPQQRAAMALAQQRAAPAPQQRVTPAPQRTAPAQRQRVAAATLQPAPARVAPRPLSAPQLRPAQRPAAPARPVLIALEGADYAAAAGRRLNTPTWIVSSIVMLVVTIGAVVALQIQMTQVNEQIGSDLASITRQEQRVTQLRERISRQVGGARIEGEAGRRGLVQPDVSDVRYLKAGNRADTARRAAEALAHAPSQSAIAAAAAAAAAGTSAAGGTAQSVTADPAAVPPPTAAVVTTPAPDAALTP